MMQRQGQSGPAQLYGTGTLPAVAIGAGATTNVDASVIGAGLYDMAVANPRVDLDVGLWIREVRVVSANTVRIRVNNTTGAPIVPAVAITFDVYVTPKP